MNRQKVLQKKHEKKMISCEYVLDVDV